MLLVIMRDRMFLIFEKNDMAVYTKISEAEVHEIAKAYQLTVESFEPVEGGISNSNYLLNCTEGKFILTIFEDGGFEGAKRLAKLLIWFKKRNFRTTRLRLSASGDAVLSWH